MRFIPTHCESCSRSGLVNAEAIHGGFTQCADCGATARSLPGESYSEEDVSLYYDVATTLRDAGVAPFQARQLAMELEAKSLLEPGRCLQRLVQMLPSLGALELLVNDGDPLALRKLEGMLSILLDVMGSSRSESGMVSSSDSSKASGGRA